VEVCSTNLRSCVIVIDVLDLPGMKCVENVKRSFLAFFWALSKYQNRSKCSSLLASPTCNIQPFLSIGHSTDSSTRFLHHMTFYCVYISFSASVFVIRGKLFRSEHDSQIISGTWCSMWRITKTRMSFVYSQSMYLPHTFYESSNRLARADIFITQALSAGGKVLVHCNGTSLLDYPHTAY